MVNPAITAALIAASRQEDVEKLEGRLRKAKALSASSAIALELKSRDHELLDRALADGTIKRTGDGRFYLNERVIADRKEGKGLMALLITLAVASVVASVAVLAGQAGN